MNRDFAQTLLEEFLSLPQQSADAVFDRFLSLSNILYVQGDEPSARYLYRRGTAAHPVLLVAHADTVQPDVTMRGRRHRQRIVCKQERYLCGKNPSMGIGADDRAGCAMLWALRDAGFSLLLLDGSTNDSCGARYLIDTDPALTAEIGTHSYIVYLDYTGTGSCVFPENAATAKFRQHILQSLGFSAEPRYCSGDLELLARDICGVNVGVGFHRPHKPKEYVDLNAWLSTYRALKTLSQRQQPHFPVSRSVRGRRVLHRLLGK